MIKTKKNKKQRIILVLCTLFICICSVLCLVPFKQDKISVKADTITPYGYDYVGSMIPMHYTLLEYINGNYYFDDYHIYALNACFDFSSNANNVLTSISFRSINPYVSSELYDGFVVMTDTFPSNQLNSSYFTLDDVRGFRGYLWQPSVISDYIYKIRVLANNFDADGNIIFGRPIKFDYEVSPKFDGMADCLYFYDANGNQLRFYNYFYWEFNDSDIDYYEYYNLPLRTYYFSDDLDLTDNEYYNQGYSSGVTQGYNDGYSAGESAGYNNGYNVGNNVGYNNGYSEGLEDSNQYTFMNLLSATIDAPVKYFQSLFNFELLGVNLQGFLTGLFTLCVIVTIFKLCLGG